MPATSLSLDVVEKVTPDSSFQELLQLLDLMDVEGLEVEQRSIVADALRCRLLSFDSRFSAFLSAFDSGSRQSLRAVRNGIPDAWRPRRLSELSDELGDVDWIWDGYIAHRAISLFTGVWKGGKTTLLSHLLKEMGGQSHFAGRDVSRCHVLMVTEEDEGLWAGREAELQIGDHVRVISRPFLARPSQQEWEDFVRYLVTEEPDLVVFDSAPNLWPVEKENDASAMLAALLPLRRLTEAGSGVLLVAHPRKGSAEEGQATRGSGSINGFVDILVELRKLEGGGRDNQRRLSVQSRYDAPDAVILAGPQEGYAPLGTSMDCEAERRLEVAIGLLGELSLRVEEIRDAWPVGDVAKPSLKTLRRALSQGVSDGRVVRCGEGKKGAHVGTRSLRAEFLPGQPQLQ